MDNLRFRKESAPARYQDDSDGGFQEFIRDVYIDEYPGLICFPASGRDGGIDLCQTLDNKRTVFECKYIGGDDPKAGKSRWKKTEDNLNKHLIYPTGPKQSQYQPWYDTTNPIQKYFLCVNLNFSNLSQTDAFKNNLKEEIKAFFNKLAKDHLHLKHLEELEVQIIDAKDTEARLQEVGRRGLIFRWFTDKRPNGLIPFEDYPEPKGFRAYLGSNKLPYYSLSEHKSNYPVPSGNTISDEKELLESLGEDDDKLGLVIHGPGGVGKTRLTLEMGSLAQKNGWLVFFAAKNLKGDALEKLAELIAPTNRVLIILDYLETRKDFAEITKEIQALNQTFQHHIRFVANTRENFYHYLTLSDDQFAHHEVSLSPFKASLGDWWNSYHRQIKLNILEQLHIDDPSKNGLMDQPVLWSVLCLYLYEKSSNINFKELLADEYFSHWIKKRIARSFKDSGEIGPDLGKLIALFPLQTSARGLLEEKYQKMIDVLLKDGWIEAGTPDEEKGEIWETVHDVLADQVFLSCQPAIPALPNHLHDLFNLAAEADSIESAMYTMERSAEKVAQSGATSCFPNLISQSWDSHFEAWQAHLELPFRLSLLTDKEKLDFFLQNTHRLEGVEKELPFQHWLAETATALAKPTPPFDLPPEQRSLLVKWLKKTASNEIEINNIYIAGLRIGPENFRIPALEWMHNNQVVFETHHLLVAWLEQCNSPSNIEWDQIKIELLDWIDRFSGNYHFSSVVKAWLDAGGGATLVQPHIKNWLEAHDTEKEARFVYKSWLDVNWEISTIEPHIKKWLEGHATNEKAGFVYSSWLKAEGEKGFVQFHIKNWLEGHATKKEAQFVYSSWLKAGGEKDFVQPHIEKWLEGHATNEKAQFVYKSWLDAGGKKDLVQPHIKSWLKNHTTNEKAQFVYKSWLNAGGEKDFVQPHIEKWLEKHATEKEARFVYKSWLDAGGKKDLVQPHIKSWLKNHATNEKAQFVYKSWLDAGGDTNTVQYHIENWLKNHATNEKAQFVYSSWLDAGGDTNTVQYHIENWLGKYATEESASFIYRRWLRAGGEKGFVQPHLKKWLNNHNTEKDAQFVYKSWLDAGGEKDLVQPHIKSWLKNHATNEKAQFVYRSWLDAGGEFSVIKVAALKWFDLHHKEFEAAFLIKPLTKLKDLPHLSTVQNMLTWCQEFPKSEDALWCLPSLGKFIKTYNLTEDFCKTLEIVIQPVLNSGSKITSDTNQSMCFLFSHLICAPSGSAYIQNQLDDLFITWLRCPGSYGKLLKSYPATQQIRYFQRVVDLVEMKELDVDEDREPLTRFLYWVNTWEPINKFKLKERLDYLKKEFPASGLWEIVRLD